MAVLISKTTFKAFVISDSMAMTSSITAVVIVFWSSSRRDVESFMDTLPFAIGFTWISLIAMAIAFVSGLFMVLQKTLWLATLVCVIRIFVQPQGHSVCVGGYVIVVVENTNALLHLLAWTFSLCDSPSL
ncbi:hypothetical protein GOBAR_AA24386 [Gossypium barbadense]|uniref:PGG domain-containing protein n=1 Tax=Gossypium barbadense TaxID=3634 RepID=A0A2P5WYY2_GOSBA|nr:hypothetical protein GOBAR_AA24386 [Gossypium barbadense]